MANKNSDKQGTTDVIDKDRRLQDLDGAESVTSGRERVLECAVCLQTCIHPVELPCHHIFCYLCVKGVANQSKRCALCRQEIPVDFLNNPRLLNRDDLLRNVAYEDGQQWFYEGRNGWWQYDERTSSELEDKYKKGLKTFDILVAGFLYVVDLDNMLQFRRTDPTRRRKIKRDSVNIPKKGVAGLKLVGDADAENRVVADGGERGSDDGVPHLTRASRDAGQSHRDGVPPPPSNTPQSPDTGSPGRVSPLPEEALTATMSSLTLHDGQTSSSPPTRLLVGIDNSQSQGPGPDRSLPQPGSPAASSDSDWD